MTQTTTPDTLPEVSIPCAECDIPINPETAGTLRLCADCKGDYERWLSRLAPHEQARHLAARASQEAEEKAETLQQAHDGGDHDVEAAPEAPPLRSTERTAAGLQTLAPWAPAMMDTHSRLRTRGTQDVPMPLFTQDEDAAARAEASRQTTLFGDDTK